MKKIARFCAIVLICAIAAGCANAPHWCKDGEYAGSGCVVHYSKGKKACALGRTHVKDRWGRTYCADDVEFVGVPHVIH